MRAAGIFGAVALGCGALGAAAATSVPRGWAWFEGDPQAFVGMQAPSGALWLGSTGDVECARITCG